jgi:prepilin-type N-terminal cleavage/methylation domain-containing protein/prepilin-type processing-associated H-X9-DG protein
MNHIAKLMKSEYTKLPAGSELQEPSCRPSAFTLIELLVVLAMVALLSGLLLPGLAGTKTDSWRTQCQSCMKQLCVGFNLYVNDHDDQYPPAGWDNGTSSQQAAWDSYIHPYIGGRYPQALMVGGTIPVEETPKAEQCPADILPSGWPGDWAGRRSYAMIPPGNWNVGTQVNAPNRNYWLPSIGRPGVVGPNGVGIYWRVSGDSQVDWDARGYRTTALPDPSGTGLLVEQQFNNNPAGDIWTCFSYGPYSLASPGETFQMSAGTGVTSPGSGFPVVSYGAYTYRVHGYRFNYLFHDGHVAPLTIEQSAGTGNAGMRAGSSQAKGLWTATPGD